MADVGEMTRGALDAASKVKDSADGAASNPKGMAAAGVALIALPYAVQGVAKLVGGASEKASDAAGGKASEVAKRTKQEATQKGKEAVKEAAGEKLKPKQLLGGLFGGKDEGDEGEEGDGGGSAAPGYGSGRRMPIQQAVDVAVPVDVAYNQWTQFEQWPEFMHRVDSVEQVDDATVAITTKVWGINKRFTAKIQEQRPDERIEWDVEQGLSHTGVVTFHELAPRLTRIDVDIDIEPQGMLEKMGRGMRFTKRAVRGDLHRFKAYVELNEEAEGGWRGTIADGEVKRRTERKSSGSSRSRSGSSNGRSRSSGARSSNGSKSSSRKASK